MLQRLLVSMVIILGLCGGAARAEESSASELLQRVPDELGLCLVIHDLRGACERLRTSPWLTKLKENPLVQGLLGGKEVRDLQRFEEELKKHLQFDLAFLRDEILGDAVVFAYQPAPAGQGGEMGLLLVKARSAEAMTDVISKINTLQTNVGELTALEERMHVGQVYYRRVHQRTTHFYVQRGGFLAVANREELIQKLLDRGPAAPSARRDLWIKAGMSKAAATLILNPRVFDVELTAQATGKAGPEAVLAQSVLKFWQGLDGVLVGLQGDNAPEISLTLVARSGTEAAKLWNVVPTAPSDLWRRFPENALISATGQVDFAVLLKQLQSLLPENDARNLDLQVLKNLGALGLDVTRDILPNIGPDLGFAVTLPEGNGMPRALVALAAKSAPKEAPVDQMLVKSAQLFVGFAVFEFNRKNNDSPMRIRTVQQGGVEVKYLTHDKFFPPGVQPAIALKGGYLLFASTPETIADFRVDTSGATSASETPLIKIAPREWSRLMKTHRQAMIDHLVQKNKETPAAASNVIDGVAAGFDLFQSLTLSQRLGGGQAAWIIRLTPSKN